MATRIIFYIFLLVIANCKNANNPNTSKSFNTKESNPKGEAKVLNIESSNLLFTATKCESITKKVEISGSIEPLKVSITISGRTFAEIDDSQSLENFKTSIKKFLDNQLSLIVAKLSENNSNLPPDTDEMQHSCAVIFENLQKIELYANEKDAVLPICEVSFSDMARNNSIPNCNDLKLGNTIILKRGS